MPRPPILSRCTREPWTLPKSILIADDDARVRRLVRAGLEHAGFSCVESADGLDAVDKATRCSPDLIILDLRMPKLSGIEASCILRERFPAVPILLLTMYTPGPRVASVVGVTAMFDKSEGVKGLVECVHRLLGLTPDASAPLLGDTEAHSDLLGGDRN